jgi:hypothetical protein
MSVEDSDAAAKFVGDTQSYEQCAVLGENA